MRIAMPMALILALQGCSAFRDITGQSDYVVTQASAASITIRFEEGELAQAQGRAEAHCKQYQRASVLRGVQPADGDSIATFDCK